MHSVHDRLCCRHGHWWSCARRFYSKIQTKVHMLTSLMPSFARYEPAWMIVILSVSGAIYLLVNCSVVFSCFHILERVAYVWGMGVMGYFRSTFLTFSSFHSARILHNRKLEKLMAYVSYTIGLSECWFICHLSLLCFFVFVLLCCLFGWLAFCFCFFVVSFFFLLLLLLLLILGVVDCLLSPQLLRNPDRCCAVQSVLKIDFRVIIVRETTLLSVKTRSHWRTNFTDSAEWQLLFLVCPCSWYILVVGCFNLRTICLSLSTKYGAKASGIKV